ncbi:SGNH/GDSL hydrolase family protein [Saccharopolyspora sp. 5N708]|uniref:SGNH/GDSL hydrolase family protein n=1 Tax=Saccharopolyspora sp. 5N708 TaxID=3457424 RepID=UPI003FD2171C
MDKIMLFGDSMLARFTKPRIQQLERELGGDATLYNCAAGGWDSTDGVTRAPVLAGLGCSTVVLSFGGNDCAPWKRVALDQFTANIGAIVDAFAGASLVAFLPPVIEEIERPGLGMRTNRELDQYREVLRSAVGADACLETDRILSPGGTARGLEDDGLHLTGESYTSLIPPLAQVIARTLTRPAERGTTA